MIDHYIAINRLLRGIHARCQDGMDAERVGADGYAQGAIRSYVERDAKELSRIWPADLSRAHLDQIREAVRQADHDGFYDVVSRLMPELEDQVDGYFGANQNGDVSVAILDLIHPIILESSYAQFRNGNLRDAVLNAIVAVFDRIRERTGLDKDGSALVTEALSLEHPKLVLSTLDSETGRNDQKGFMQILQGAYLGVRNPKAHSLVHNLDQRKAAQYLVFASLLARRIEDAHLP